MHRMPLAGLKSRSLIPNTVRACLGSPGLLYNWDEKLTLAVVGIALARSVVLKDVACARAALVKTSLNLLSGFLNQDRLDLGPTHRTHVIAVLRRLGRKRFVLYRGRLVLIIDTTGHPKTRSRGKKSPMPHLGKVRLKNLPTQETLLVPGYTEIWTGLLLKDRSCLGITRRLMSEKHPLFRSQNGLEEAEIIAAKELVLEALGLPVILVADSGFRRKDLLERLVRQDRTAFLIRLEGKVNVEIGGSSGLLEKLAPCQPERLRTFWRAHHRNPVWSVVRAFQAWFQVERGKPFTVNVLCLFPVEGKPDPMYLATSLPIRTQEDLKMLVWLYSSRWAIETFFWNFKEAFRVGRFRVFSSWEAVDRLLTMAHMAYLVLHLLYLLCEKTKTPLYRGLWLSAQALLRRWSIRQGDLTLGKFFEAIAMDFALSRPAWGCP